MLKLHAKLAENGLFDVLKAQRERIGASQMEPFIPQQFIDVGWGDKDSENVALFGNHLPISRTWDKPNVIFELSESTRSATAAALLPKSTANHYCIVAFDADYSSGGDRDVGNSSYLLWARVNIAGDDIQYASGRDVVRWQPPHPARSDSPHRIFVVVLHQTGGAIDVSTTKIISKNSREGRNHFSLDQFMSEHKMQHVIGANCWRVSYDENVVPKIVKELRDKVVLDESGKRVLREELNGVVVYERSAPATAAATAAAASSDLPS